MSTYSLPGFQILIGGREERLGGRDEGGDKSKFLGLIWVVWIILVSWVHIDILQVATLW